MSMGQEVGVAYVTLLPSGRGFGKAVEKDLDGTVVRHDKAQQSLWSRVAKYGAIAAAAIGAVFTAKVIKGGLSRALNIEDAQAKLKGLGHDTEIVTEIMTNALAAVKGTAFGLDAAATIAASAVAAGIKPGQQLERYLRLTADAATIAGSSLSEMGSILNKVQGSGKAYNDSLQQLADRGIPIYQWLADEIGATTDEVFKLASQGKISSEQFQAAIEKNVAGAALASGDTTRGAFANMMAAMSRWGANLLTGVLPFAKTFFDEMIIIFDGLNERSAPFMDRFNGWLSGLEVEGMGERFLGWLDNLDLTTLTDTLAALSPILGVVRELGPEIALLAPPLRDLLIALLPLLPQLVELAVAVLPVLASVLEAVVPALLPVIERLTDFFDAIQLIQGVLSGKISGDQYLESVRELGGPFETVMDTLRNVFEMLELGVELFRNFAGGVRGAVEQVGEAWETVGRVIGDASRVIVGIVTGDSELIAEGLSGLRTRLGKLWEDITGAAASGVESMWSGLKSRFTSGVLGIVDTVKNLPTKLQEALAGARTWLYEIGRNVVEGLINGIVSMVNAAVRSVQNLSSSMVSGMKDWLGIKSPSRVFRDEVGAQIAAGVIAGVDGMRVQTDTAIRSLVSVPAIEPMGGAQVEINANGVDPMTAALLVKREVAALLAVR